MMLFNRTTAEIVPESGTMVGVGFLFDFECGCYRMENGSPVEVAGKDAVKVWISQVIHTRRPCAIYPADFGCAATEIYKKTPKGYLASELSRQLAESVAYCPAIREVSALTASGSTLSCTVTMETEVIDVEYDT